MNTGEIAKEQALETESRPKCGFDIEKGSKCPFCAEEKPQEKQAPSQSERNVPMQIKKSERLKWAIFY